MRQAFFPRLCRAASARMVNPWKGKGGQLRRQVLRSSHDLVLRLGSQKYERERREGTGEKGGRVRKGEGRFECITTCCKHSRTEAAGGEAVGWGCWRLRVCSSATVLPPLYPLGFLPALTVSGLPPGYPLFSLFFLFPLRLRH